uniref:ribosomal protein L16 n=1 Tax=Hypnea musciformis TaxID=31429 RepID=UPI00300308D2|nr:ribosomal protein L16 [Hypnea musciformis]
MALKFDYSMNSFIKSQIKYNYKKNQSNNILRKGSYGLKSLSFGRLTKSQLYFLKDVVIKSSRKITNSKKSIKIWTKIILNFNLTKLSSEARMGKGKGSIYTQASFVKPGAIIFEFELFSYAQAQYVFLKVSKCCNLKLALIKR